MRQLQVLLDTHVSDKAVLLWWCPGTKLHYPSILFPIVPSYLLTNLITLSKWNRCETQFSKCSSSLAAKLTTCGASKNKTGWIPSWDSSSAGPAMLRPFLCFCFVLSCSWFYSQPELRTTILKYSIRTKPIIYQVFQHGMGVGGDLKKHLYLFTHPAIFAADYIESYVMSQYISLETEKKKKKKAKIKL